MEVGKYYVSHWFDESFENYKIDENEDTWCESSGYACIFCQVYKDEKCNEELGEFIIHKAEIIQYLELDDETNILNIDMDDVFNQMAESGFMEGFFIKPVIEEKRFA